MKILEFLNSKPLYYAKIDYERMPRIYEKYKKHFNLKPIIHTIGTNGKGTTSRWLALMLKEAGFLVGHYTSPHIKEYNERFWLDGLHVSYEELDLHHKELYEILGEDDANSLSYFEYSTLLASLVFKECDYVILEAGLGGEYDATNVFRKKLSLITAIGFDHGDFLGYTIQSITKTKVNSISSTAIIAPQAEKSVVKIAQEIAYKKRLDLVDVSKKCTLMQKKHIKDYCKKYNYPSFLISNLQTAFISAMQLGVKPNFATLPPLDLAGRCQKIKDNITIDVGHNPLSAEVLREHFKKTKVTLIYNSFDDKDIYSTLSVLKPIISYVEILPFESYTRKTGESKIKKTLSELGISWQYFNNKINEDENYLVFGSFHVVEEFLKTMNER